LAETHSSFTAWITYQYWVPSARPVSVKVVAAAARLPTCVYGPPAVVARSTAMSVAPDTGFQARRRRSVPACCAVRPVGAGGGVQGGPWGRADWQAAGAEPHATLPLGRAIT
jgi:hypothetical protein